MMRISIVLMKYQYLFIAMYDLDFFGAITMQIIKRFRQHLYSNLQELDRAIR